MSQLSGSAEEETKHNIVLLLDRPLEPCFMPKGEEKKQFDIPPSYLPDKYQSFGMELSDRFGEDAAEKIPVHEISIPPMEEIMLLKRHENFSLFIPKHYNLAAKLINIFMGVRNVDDLLSVSVYARERVNPYMFNYCLSVALLHRPDTRNVAIPSHMRTFPDKYIDSKVFIRAREAANIVPTGSRVPIEIPRDYTASNLEEEHRLAYFREDIGINLHHWHWHLVYPYFGDINIVRKDRRGELFYYMHRQIIARYNCERLCNSLKRTERLINWREPIKEAYFPKLDSVVASRGYPARVADQVMQNINRTADNIKQDLVDLEMWRDRVFEAINSGAARDTSGGTIPMDEYTGIDILGNMLESSILSPNRAFYGDLHNNGHVFTSLIHDPDHRHLETFGVMGDTTTAMRDPVFYRWHAYIDDMCQQHKNTLPKYPIEKLNNPGISVSSIRVETKGSSTPNVLQTYWMQSDVDLSWGMDFQPRGAVYVRFTHLQHTEFNYVINVTNSGVAKMGTCRIFMAPKFDERGNEWLIADQRLMYIELDRFPVTLKQGQNVIRRRSVDSTVTIPWERTFRNFTNRPTGGDELAQWNFCGCGWPQHMLLPKGTPEGYRVHLFVMISNYEDDHIDQDISGKCNDAYAFCGVKDKLYPDKRSMGYPFDRLPRDGVVTLQQFLTPNMRVQELSIVHSDRTEIAPADNN